MSGSWANESRCRIVVLIDNAKAAISVSQTGNNNLPNDGSQPVSDPLMALVDHRLCEPKPDADTPGLACIDESQYG